MFGPTIHNLDFLIPITFFICVTYLIAVRLGRGGMNKKDRFQWGEETRLMQEMHDDLARMEERIEALETILMPPPGKDRR
jgi:phage shock protein B